MYNVFTSSLKVCGNNDDKHSKTEYLHIWIGRIQRKPSLSQKPIFFEDNAQLNGNANGV